MSQPVLHSDRDACSLTSLRPSTFTLLEIGRFDGGKVQRGGLYVWLRRPSVPPGSIGESDLLKCLSSDMEHV